MHFIRRRKKFMMLDVQNSTGILKCMDRDDSMSEQRRDWLLPRECRWSERKIVHHIKEVWVCGN